MTDMKRCSKCGQDKPATLEFFAAEKRRPSGLSSWCRECQRADAKRRRDADPEPGRARALAYYAQNEERCKARMRAAHQERMADPLKAEAERERTREKARQERQANPEKVRERVRKSRALHLDAVRQGNRVRANAAYAADPAKFRARAAVQRAARAGAAGGYTGPDLHALFKKQKGCCAYCGEKVGGRHRPWHADHFIPLSRGGTNLPENIVIACEPCNRSKYNKMPWEWLPEKFSPPPATT